MYLCLELGNELGSLLGKDIEQSPKFAVLDVFGGVPKHVLSSPARLDETVQYGDHFIVVHISPPSLIEGAIAVPLGRLSYATVGLPLHRAARAKWQREREQIPGRHIFIR
jgi:hypothetical protein